MSNSLPVNPLAVRNALASVLARELAGDSRIASVGLGVPPDADVNLGTAIWVGGVSLDAEPAAIAADQFPRRYEVRITVHVQVIAGEGADDPAAACATESARVYSKLDQIVASNARDAEATAAGMHHWFIDTSNPKRIDELDGVLPLSNGLGYTEGMILTVLARTRSRRG